MAQGEDDTVASATTLGGLGAASAALPELIGGRYRISRWLGGGGMGRVYAAVDAELGETVALKVLRDGLSDDAIERFRREVRLTRRIQHRNVARMFDIGEHGGVKFLTMELVDGVPLSQLGGTLLSWRRLGPIAAQLCDGLAAAHAVGVVHRDLKPDNVIIENGTDRAVITDFGIARSLDESHVTQVGAVIGTPRYMSPEQLAGEDIDARSDIFSLGVMLYELASGERPWSGDNPITIAVAQVTQPMRPLRADHTPPAFQRLVEQCLATAKADRPESARALGDALAADAGEAVRTHRPSLATPPVGTPITGSHALTPARPTPAPAHTYSPTATHGQPASSLAVLPVTCATGDEYLADGVLDDLIDTLSSGNVRVRPVGLVRALAAPDPREVGRQLEVDHVVTAALRRTPTGLRVTARLISVSDGFQVWAHRVECSEAEILRVTDELARGIAAALSTRASTGAEKPTDPRAVELYLRARAELRRFWGSHAAEAADLLDRAVAIAPDSSAILAAHALSAVQAWVMTTEAIHAPRARAALERGLVTGHGEAYLASAIYKLNCGDAEGSAADLAIAIARAPMSAPAHEICGRVIVEIGLVADARQHWDTAIGLDPGRAQVVACDIARLDALHGDYASAYVRLAPLIADLDPAVSQLGTVFHARISAWHGDNAGMVAAAKRFRPMPGQSRSLLQEYIAKIAYDRSMLDTESWQKFMAEFDEPDRPLRQPLMGLQLLTEVALGVGRTDSALATLRRAADAGLMDIVWVDKCPLIRKLVDLPEFPAIRAKVAERAARVLAAYRGATQ